MVFSRVRVVAAVGAAVAMVAAGGSALASTGPASVASRVAGMHGKLHVREFNVPFRGLRSGSMHAALAAPTVPLWSSSIKVGTKKFSYAMVGKNPFVKQKAPSVNITAPIVPIVFNFASGNAGGSFNPNVAKCGEKRSDVKLVNQSPVFTKLNWKSGKTAVGRAEYVDAFQRAEFWKFVGGAKHLNPNYHVNLTTTVLKPVTVNVPASDGAVVGSGCKALGLLDLIDWDSFLQGTLIPALKNIKATTIPIILFRNVAMFDQHNPQDCCALGYHSGFFRSQNVPQFYTVTDIDDSHQFTGVVDVSDLAHEVGEWMDDPFGGNPTPAWGHVGQVPNGCQTNLEVGDPLTGKNLKAKAANGVTYHPQELAFFSWFYRQRPSIGASGLYSFAGTFKAPSKVCT
jgi:hypothetical protein